MPDESGRLDQGLTPSQRQRWQEFSAGCWLLYRGIQRELDLAGAQLNSPDWRLLERLSLVPKMRIGDLAEASHIGLSTVSRQVTGFIRNGYAVRVDADRDDARQKWVQITDAGRAAVEPVLEERDRIVRRLIVDRLGCDDFEQLCRMMQRISVPPE